MEISFQNKKIWKKKTKNAERDEIAHRQLHLQERTREF